MDNQESVKQRVVEAVVKFEKDQMSVTPESVSVDFHPNAVVVTLQGAMCPAEKQYARNKQARALLEGFYSQVFDATKPILEASIEDVLGQRVERSRLSVDPESGNSVILVMLRGKSYRQNNGKDPGNAKILVQ